MTEGAEGAFFCRSITRQNSSAGARFRALTALDTLSVIDHGQIINHRDCAGRAGLRALSAGDAAIFAYVHHRFSFIVRGAGDVDLCVRGDALKEVFRARFYAGAAGSAAVGVDVRAAVF